MKKRIYKNFCITLSFFLIFLFNINNVEAEKYNCSNETYQCISCQYTIKPTKGVEYNYTFYAKTDADWNVSVVGEGDSIVKATIDKGYFSEIDDNNNYKLKCPNMYYQFQVGTNYSTKYVLSYKKLSDFYFQGTAHKSTSVEPKETNNNKPFGSDDPSKIVTSCDVNIMYEQKVSQEESEYIKSNKTAKVSVSQGNINVSKMPDDMKLKDNSISSTISTDDFASSCPDNIYVLCKKISNSNGSIKYECTLNKITDIDSIKSGVTVNSVKTKTRAKSMTCAEIDDLVTEYKTDKEILDTGVCDDTEDYNSVETCKEAQLNRNIIVTDLMKLQEQNGLCDSNKAAVAEIISENEDKCGKVFDDDFTNIVNTIMKIFYIIGPILLVIFTTVDYTRAIVSYEKDVMKKTNKRFIKRIMATIILFISPFITNIILSLNISDYALSGNSYSCQFEYVQYNKKYQIKYVSNPSPKYNSISTTSVNVVNTGGITTDEEMNALTEELNNMLNTKIHGGTDSSTKGMYQNGPFPEYWTTPINQLQKFQCTWWANGRASQYLASHGTVYKEYPTQIGHGGQYYDVNKENGYFNYGQTPKPNSIISWKKSGDYGHVAYVEGVTNDAIYISHAGSGVSWRGVEKIAANGDIGWSGYTLNGFIYLDEPIEK